MFFCLPLQIQRGGRDLPQTGFRNVARGYAEGARRLSGVELADIPEILRLKIQGGLNAAANEKHVGHAVLDGGSEFRLQIQIIQFFQQAVTAAVPEVCQIIREIVGRRVLGRRYERFG
ncbi:MAG: hypothetical protein LBK56_02570 [Gracilibacteraceae bacterium]|nr:hypothetical protein [Gracilibacteraceae bacterium]